MLLFFGLVFSIGPLDIFLPAPLDAGDTAASLAMILSKFSQTWAKFG